MLLTHNSLKKVLKLDGALVFFSVITSGAIFILGYDNLYRPLGVLLKINAIILLGLAMVMGVTIPRSSKFRNPAIPGPMTTDYAYSSTSFHMNVYSRNVIALNNEGKDQDTIVKKKPSSAAVKKDFTIVTWLLLSAMVFYILGVLAGIIFS